MIQFFATLTPLKAKNILQRSGIPVFPLLFNTLSKTKITAMTIKKLRTK